MLSMATRPLPNTPQQLLDFVETLRRAVADPSSLAPLVRAAEDIARANAVSEELAAQETAALAAIEEAKAREASLMAQQEALAEALAILGRGKDDILAREQRNEVRTKELNWQQEMLKQSVEEHDGKHKELQARIEALAQRELEAEAKEQTLSAREHAVVKREQSVLAAQQGILASTNRITIQDIMPEE